VRRPAADAASGETHRKEQAGEVPPPLAQPADPGTAAGRDELRGNRARIVDAVAGKLGLELGESLAQIAQSPIISFTYFAAGEPNDSIVSCSFLSCFPFPCFFSHAARISFISMLPT